MQQMTALIKRFPLIAYFVLAFLVTWIGILIIGLPAGMPAQAVGMGRVGLVFLAMIAGPSLAGLLITTALEGSDGRRELFARMRRWQVGARWYAIAVLTTPLVVLTTLLTLTVFVSPGYLPNLMVPGIIIGLIAGLVEEIGWTGFALPRLLARHNVLAAGLLLGLIWGLWHGLADYWGRGAIYGDTWLPIFLTFVVSVTAYRILMAWVYAHSQSLLLAQLMHACYTGSLAFFGPTTSHQEEFIWNLIVAALLWCCVGVVVLSNRRSVRRSFQIQVR